MSALLQERSQAGWPDILHDFVLAEGIGNKRLARELQVDPSCVRNWWAGGRPSHAVWVRLVQWGEARGLDLQQLVAMGELHDLNKERAVRSRPRRSGGGTGRDGSGTTPPPIDPPEEPVQILTREYLTPDDLSHFGLPADPFEDDAMPDDLFMPKGLVDIENQLVRGIRGRKIVVLAGPAGAGKSAIVRRMWALSEREKRVKLIAPAQMDRRRVNLASLTVAILRDLLGRDTSSMAAEARAQLLRETLQAQVEAGQFPVVFIDEAHDLKDQALIEIKRLWDSHVLFRQISIILVGQTPLASRLRTDQTLAELAGRAQVIELPQWGADAVAAYLAWRVARVGGGELGRLFDTGALKAIASRADRPLWINNVAVLALRQARLIGDQTVVATHVGRV